MEIVAVQHQGEARVSTRDLAGRMGNKHANVLSLVRDYQENFEAFGRVTFETRPLETPGGTQNTTFALLNENQCYFLLTLVRNSEQTVPMKAELVRAFNAARTALTAPASPLALSRAMLEALEQQEARLSNVERRLDLAPIQGEQVGTIHRQTPAGSDRMIRAFLALFDRQPREPMSLALASVYARSLKPAYALPFRRFM